MIRNRSLILLLLLRLLNGQTPAELSAGTPPVLKSKQKPHYSSAALDAHVQGTVLLNVVINEVGVVEEIAIVSPLGYGLDEQATEAVRHWRFKPGMKNGQPIKVNATVEVDFRISGQMFDQKAEERRTDFNALLSQISKSKDQKPSEADVKAMQDLADNKSAAAIYAIGLWQVQGQTLTKDASAGLAHIQMAADLGNGPALYYIGLAQFNGDGMPKDEAAGLLLMQKAAANGSQSAQYFLGQVFQQGTRGGSGSKTRQEILSTMCRVSNIRVPIPARQVAVGVWEFEESGLRTSHRLAATGRPVRYRGGALISGS